MAHGGVVRLAALAFTAAVVYSFGNDRVHRCALHQAMGSELLNGNEVQPMRKHFHCHMIQYD